MGTITGYTAARMKEIEDASVVDGEVVSDNLILTRQNGTTINAGSVRGPKGNIGSKGPTGEPGIPGPMGLIYRTVLSILPGDKRQVSSAETEQAVYDAELNTSNLPAGIEISLTRRYQYMLCGSIVFDTANAGGDLRVNHTDPGTPTAMLWQGIAFRAGQPHPLSAMSAPFKVGALPFHFWVHMTRSIGTGAMTIDPNLGACELMLFDVGELVP